MCMNMAGERAWPSIAVVGAGAVGCYFGGMLARAGAPVTLIGRARHMDAIAREGLRLDTLKFTERVAIPTATEMAAAGHAHVILLSVKTVDTETAAMALMPHLAPAALVVSMQNGVDNVERIRRAAGIAALPAAVWVAAAMVEPGHVKHSGRGDLAVGADGGRSDLVAAMFERAGVPCRVSGAIGRELWAKMCMNCAYNAISALARSRYGRMIGTPSIRDLMDRIVAETVAVARAEGVPLEAGELIDAAHKLGEAMAGATSSTEQDIGRGKPTEIDSLNGYVARRGAAQGVPTPINDTLWALVKLLEGRE
jgi:2-dehydropantoate 2-reductase